MEVPDYERAVRVLVHQKPPDFKVVPVSPYTFDDIETWDEIYFRQEVYWVSDKGPHVNRTDGSHIEMWGQHKNRVHVMHEKWVNHFLNERRQMAPIVGDYATTST